MRYIQIKTDEGWELVPADAFPKRERKAPYVWSDLKAYVPVAGPEAQAIINRSRDARYIDGRKQHREFLKRNDLTVVGNDSSYRPENMAARHGKTPENYEKFNKRTYRGYNVTEMAKETPTGWSDPDTERLSR